MVDKQKLHHALLRFFRVVTRREDLHAFGRGRGARGHRLRRFFNLHQAHAAIRGDGQFFVIAEVRDVRAHLIGRVHHGATRCDLYRFAVDFEV